MALYPVVTASFSGVTASFSGVTAPSAGGHCPPFRGSLPISPGVTASFSVVTASFFGSLPLFSGSLLRAVTVTALSSDLPSVGSEARVHTVQLALAGGAAGRPAGPTLGTGVPAEGWTLAGTVALQCRPMAGTGWQRALECRPKVRPLPFFRSEKTPKRL